jgi:hypothetical protein
MENPQSGYIFRNIISQLHVSALTAIHKDTRLDTNVGNASLYIAGIIFTVKTITTHFCFNPKFKNVAM